MAPKRVLQRQTYSDTCRAIREEPGVSDRTKRRILSIAKETAQYVPLERRSAKAALKKMATVHVSTLRNNNAHTSFCDTEPRLREDGFKGWRIWRDKKRIEDTVLFDRYTKAKTCTFKADEVDKLCQTMCNIHCHNVRAESDSLHSSTIAVIRAHGAMWKKIRCSSLFLEFSWLPHNRPKCAQECWHS